VFCSIDRIPFTWEADLGHFPSLHFSEKGLGRSIWFFPTSRRWPFSPLRVSQFDLFNEQWSSFF